MHGIRRAGAGAGVFALLTALCAGLPLAFSAEPTAPTSNSTSTATSAPVSTVSTTSTTSTVPVATSVPTTGSGSTTTRATSVSTSGSGCGLAGAVFCESFAAPAGNGSRTGDLSPSRWSVSRLVGEGSASDLMSFPATPVSACKSGVSSVRADRDLLVCDGSSGHAGQLLTALSAQNYGLLSMRPRQQFDFAGRTGTIGYNVDALTAGTLSWWTSVFVTDDPMAGASDSAQRLGTTPRNGIGLNFDDPCMGTNANRVAVGGVFVYNNYVETQISDPNKACVSTQRGSLNRIEVRLSQSRVEVWASDFSTDGGATFPNFRRIFTAPINLSISRGYVHFQQAERAPVKYGSPLGYANNYWSKLAFDGPNVGNETGYAVPDALGTNPSNGATTIGYGLLRGPPSAYKCCNGSAQIPVTFTVEGVDLTGVTRAELRFAVFYTYANGATSSNVSMQYSLNGKALRTPPQPNYAAQQICDGCPATVPFYFAVELSDLQPGTNTIVLAPNNTPNSWPPVLANLELLTHR